MKKNKPVRLSFTIRGSLDTNTEELYGLSEEELLPHLKKHLEALVAKQFPEDDFFKNPTKTSVKVRWKNLKRRK